MTHKTKKKKLDDSMDVDESPTNRPSTSRQIHDLDREYLVNGDTEEPLSDEENGFRIDDIYIPPAPRPALTFDPTGPRLIISHIINENFKSYAGVQTLGPFHKSFTAIIGPNGSGKSNVIDSMLFVFGYRASKIRSKKISVLIHSSSKFPNVKSATVSVHFCRIIDGEGDEFTLVPNSEIVISRTAFRDSSSFYTLNGRRVQFRQVARMLRDNGIDLDYNRFLILQGEVELISMMKPKAVNEHESGMLEYLEDIIGTSRYKEPIEKLNIRVEELTNHRKEKLNRVRLVELEKAKLEEPMREAVELVHLNNTSTRTRNMLLQKYIHETQKLIEEKEQDLDDLKVNLSAIDEKLRILQHELREKNDVLREGTRKYEELRRKKDEILETMQSSKRQAVTTQADITQNKKKKANLDQLIEQEKPKLIELELIPEKNAREIEECKTLLARCTEQKEKLDEELQTTVASVRTKTQGLQEKKDRVQAKLIDLKRIVDEYNKRHKLAESELKLYLSTELKETQKLEKMKEDYEKAKADLEMKKPMQQEYARTIPLNVAKLNELNQKVQNAKNEEMTIISEIRPLRTQVEESRQSMSADKSRDRVLGTLLNEMENGRIPGIFGRLGDLGGIDPKYDVAISTCCSAVDHIVVDNVETAQACVQFLKDHDIGRGTFIALDKQEHLIETYQQRKTYPENASRLFDLIKVVDQRVRPAFYYVLRDTLVANDLEQATRIAFGQTRYRVVTLNGDVIETAGTMSGGGTRVMRGRMGRSVQRNTSETDHQEMREREERLAILERRLSAVRNEQSELEEAVSALPRTIREGKIMLNKLNTELKNLTDQLPIMKNQIREHEAKVEASRVDPEERARLEEAVATALEKLVKAREDAGKVEEEVRKIDAEISTVAGGKVRQLQTAVNDLVNKIDKVNSEITKLRVGINTSKRNAKKSKDKLHHMEADLRETERTLEALHNQKKELIMQNSQFEKDLEEVEEEINEGSGEYKGLKHEISKLQSKESKIKAERLEATNAVLKMERTVEDCKGKKPVWERELQSLRLEDPGIEGIPGLEDIPPLEQHTSEELEEAEVEELRNRLTAQRNRIGDCKPNIQAIKDYRDAEEMYLRRAAELDEITARRNDMRDLYDSLKKKRVTDFLTGFSTITAKLKEMYQMITLGGDAELELVDSLDPFTEGVVFSVRPPNKSWKNISNLSGGEKTLSSLALVFALHYYKPTPLYVMDEIDAALDFKNVSIVANYIKERTRNAQFIIISLRYNMFEVSNRLVGIYKTEDCTRSVTVENRLPAPLDEEPVNNDIAE